MMMRIMIKTQMVLLCQSMYKFISLRDVARDLGIICEKINSLQIFPKR